MRQNKPTHRAGALLLATLSAPAAAWWDFGHAAICTEALNHLDASSRAELDRLLAHQDFVGFGTACTWADRIKPARPETAPWHYLNSTPGVLVVGQIKRPVRGDILTALEAQAAILRDPTADLDSRSEALLWVGHLVGDLHQPLHLGWASDKGGNTYTLTLPNDLQELLGEDRKRTNMHAVWDGHILNYARNGQSLTALLDATTVTPEGQFDDWANESIALLNAPGTHYTEQRLDTLTEDYLAAQVPTALNRLKQAGMRLAALLNEALARH